MIKEPGLSTIDSPSRYGGLLICGLRRGANPTCEELEFYPPWGQCSHAWIQPVKVDPFDRLFMKTKFWFKQH